MSIKENRQARAKLRGSCNRWVLSPLKMSKEDKEHFEKQWADSKSVIQKINVTFFKDFEVGHI